ncbi:MAG: hypothetical protein WA051_00450 [Minisyncoccia bacterium]
MNLGPVVQKQSKERKVGLIDSCINLIYVSMMYNMVRSQNDKRTVQWKDLPVALAGGLIVFILTRMIILGPEWWMR